ncbi:MAG TPA: proline--tRNA ligase [Campylobacterales bacterium]|nr:proline--tRNA ligase [Campylobacterales bacterium]
MKFSRTLISTIKDYKTEGDEGGLRSQEYLTRGGFVLQIASGIYDFLPLGKMMLDNIKAIVNEELTNAGCVEVDLAFVCPEELWQKSGRAEKYGKELLRLDDRKGQKFVLSPTCEEMMVELAKSKITSYRQLPMNIYQIKLKFRDEVRPRFGLLRGREFIMKDGYSFHESHEDMLREFHLMEETYKKIFTRMELDFKVVEADSGAIGGSGSKEFMVLANAGEDTLAVCKACEYGANVEAARRKPKKRPIAEAREPEEAYTPYTKTIEELAEFFETDRGVFVKAIVKEAIYEDAKQNTPVVFFVAGDDELEETKAINAAKALALLDIDEAGLKERYPDKNITLGYVGLGVECEYFVDMELLDRNGMIMGANKADYHVKNVSVKAPFEKVKDLVLVKEGDACPKCGADLSYAKGIEAGHIFQLGTRYSEPLGAKFLDKNGKTQPFIMGTYGIGVSRLISAVIEQNSDEKGCILPSSIAPFQVDIIVSNVKDKGQWDAANGFYEELKAFGVKTILDDRDERYGHKMADFELIGFPYALIVGKNIADGTVEIVNRKTLQKEPYEAAIAAAKLKTLILGD